MNALTSFLNYNEEEEEKEEVIVIKNKKKSNENDSEKLVVNDEVKRSEENNENNNNEIKEIETEENNEELVKTEENVIKEEDIEIESESSKNVETNGDLIINTEDLPQSSIVLIDYAKQMLPKGPDPRLCSESLVNKLNKFQKFRLQGTTINKKLKSSKSFKNPSILEKLVQFCNVHENGTNYPPHLLENFNIRDYDFYDVLVKEHDKLEEERINEQKNRSKINFVAQKTTIISPPSVPAGKPIETVQSQPKLDQPLNDTNDNMNIDNVDSNNNDNNNNNNNNNNVVPPAVNVRNVSAPIVVGVSNPVNVSVISKPPVKNPKASMTIQRSAQLYRKKK